MITIRNIWIALPLLALLFVGCREPLEVQENFEFSISHLPYYRNIKVGNDVEVRCTLAEEARFVDRSYTLRHFPHSGEGELRIGLFGDPMEPNDKYELFAGDFRLYYTPKSFGSHELELVIESSDGVSKTLSLQVNAFNETFSTTDIDES